MRIHCFNLNIIWEDKRANKNAITAILDNLEIKEGEMLVFPELTLTGFTMQSEEISEVITNSDTLEFFKIISKKYFCSVLFGMAVKRCKTIYNSAIFIDFKDGSISQYNKLHTFSLAGENNYYSPGDKTQIIEHDGVKIGLSICYDLRFSHLFDAQRDLVHLFINIANWPDSRKEHWFTLAKARAIEFQAYFIGVNRSGRDPEDHTFTSNILVFDPAGNPVEYTYTKECVSTFDLNIPLVAEVRNVMDCKGDYNEFLK